MKKARSRGSRRRAFQKLELEERGLERYFGISYGRRHAVGMMEMVAVVMERKTH
jgi:hypothetical protein